MSVPVSTPTRSGFVAVIGAPNAGKSTLVNRLTGVKVSIVSPKAQTTRMRVTGIAMHGAAQIVLIDTPGIFAPKEKFERAMVAAAWEGLGEADLVLVLVDAARGLDPKTEAILARMGEIGVPPGNALLALNKVDRVDKAALLALAAQINALFPFEATFMISALSGDGVTALLDQLAARLPESEWHFPEDEVTTLPARLLAAEMTREQVFLQLQKELPYAAAVETELWEEHDDGSARIQQVLYVQRESQRAIVLGHKGSRIRSIGERARKELEEVLGRRVHLKLFVKVDERWREDPERYRALGLNPGA